MSQTEPGQTLCPDPLLEFSTEPRPESCETPPPSTPPLDPRVDKVESSVDQLVDKVASLKAEVATLVGAIDDIKKRMAHRPAPPLPTRLAMPRSSSRSASAVVGLVLGIAVATLGWTRWSRDSVDAIGPRPSLAAASPVESNSSPPPATQPATQPAAAAEAAPTEAPKPAPERVAPRLVQAAAHADYVGTLRIDAPPGSRVFINRAAAGVTPLTIARLKAGSHLVWIERDGYQRWTRVVQVPADQVTRLSPAFEPIAAP